MPRSCQFNLNTVTATSDPFHVLSTHSAIALTHDQSCLLHDSFRSNVFAISTKIVEWNLHLNNKFDRLRPCCPRQGNHQERGGVKMRQIIDIGKVSKQILYERRQTSIVFGTVPRHPRFCEGSWTRRSFNAGREGSAGILFSTDWTRHMGELQTTQKGDRRRENGRRGRSS